MNANQIASEVAAQVASKQVNAYGNQVVVSLKRDSMDSKAFAGYMELIARVNDSLKAQGAKGVWERVHGAGELRTGGRVFELYSSTLEVDG